MGSAPLPLQPPTLTCECGEKKETKMAAAAAICMEFFDDLDPSESEEPSPVTRHESHDASRPSPSPSLPLFISHRARALPQLPD